MVNQNAVTQADDAISKMVKEKGLSAEDEAELRKAVQRRSAAPKRKPESEILAKHPHAVKGTLAFDEKANKQSIEIKCSVPSCKNPRRRVFTSDLHQVKSCKPHKSEAQKAKRARRKELLAQLDAAQTKA